MHGFSLSLLKTHHHLAECLKRQKVYFAMSKSASASPPVWVRQSASSPVRVRESASPGPPVCSPRVRVCILSTPYFRRLNFFLWSIVIALLLQQVHCQKPPVYTAESCSNESVFWFFSTKSEQTV